MRNLFKLISLLLPSTFATMASAAAEAPVRVNSSFVAMLWNQSAAMTLPETGPPVELYYKNGPDFVPLNYKVCQLGQPQSYKGPNPMLIYRKVPATDGQSEYQPLMRCQIPEGSQQFIIFMVAEQGSMQSMPHRGISRTEM